MLNIIQIIYVNYDYQTLKRFKILSKDILQLIIRIYSSRYTYIMTGNSNNEIVLLNYNKKQTNLENFISLTGHKDTILVIIPITHSTIASGSKDSTIKLWAYSQNKLIKTIEAHDGPVNSLLRVDHNFLLSAGEDGLIKLWDINTSECLKIIPIKATQQFNIHLQWYKNLLLYSNDSFLYFFQFYNNDIILNKKLKVHRNLISCLTVKDNVIHTAGYEKVIIIWAKFKSKRKFSTVNVVLKILIDKDVILTAGNDKVIRIYCKNGNLICANTTNHLNYVLSALEIDNYYLFGSLDGTVSGIYKSDFKSSTLYSSKAGIYCMIYMIE
jgi:WD40 repeat protein